MVLLNTIATTCSLFIPLLVPDPYLPPYSSVISHVILINLRVSIHFDNTPCIYMFHLARTSCHLLALSSNTRNIVIIFIVKIGQII